METSQLISTWECNELVSMLVLTLLVMIFIVTFEKNFSYITTVSIANLKHDLPSG